MLLTAVLWTICCSIPLVRLSVRLDGINSGCRFEDDAIGDCDALDLLRKAESLSTSKKGSQRVGCLLIGTTFPLIQSSNSFFGHSGVHAEVNAISKYLQAQSYRSSELSLITTFSPCLECTEIIKMLPEIRDVRYEFDYGAETLSALTAAGIRHRKLITARSMPRQSKTHSYARKAWQKDIVYIRLHGLDDTTNETTLPLLEVSQESPFDCRKSIIDFFRNRKRATETYGTGYSGSFQTSTSTVLNTTATTFRMYHRGNLNHREQLFCNVLGIETILCTV